MSKKQYIPAVACWKGKNAC